MLGLPELQNTLFLIEVTWFLVLLYIILKGSLRIFFFSSREDATTLWSNRDYINSFPVPQVAPFHVLRALAYDWLTGTSAYDKGQQPIWPAGCIWPMGPLDPARRAMPLAARGSAYPALPGTGSICRGGAVPALPAGGWQEVVEAAACLLQTLAGHSSPPPKNITDSQPKTLGSSSFCNFQCETWVLNCWLSFHG